MEGAGTAATTGAAAPRAAGMLLPGARARAPARPSRQIRQGRAAMGCCGRLVRRPGEECVLCVRERVGWQPVLREKVVNTEGSGQ